MPGLWTEDPRLVAVYDAECVGRRDHDFYLSLAGALDARSVVDIGCGTGALAVDLSRHGHQVIGVDPSGPMLDVARMRAGGAAVKWIHGDATDVPTAVADLAVMTGHVAQYFVDDDDWARVLGEAHRILAGGGTLAFETRNPAVDWARRWTRDRTMATYAHPAGGEFTAWVELRETTGSADSYATVHAGHTVLPDGTHLICSETLRFRSTREIIASLETAGFTLETAWGDWDSSPLTDASDEVIVLTRRS